MATDRGHDGSRRLSASEELGATHLLDAGTPPDPYIGALVHDRYLIKRLLGEGGMGVVYEAEHVLLRRRVALKLLHRTLARNPSVVARFRNEAIAASSVGNPHIVEVSDMGKIDDGSFYIALEYLEGRELRRVIEEDGPLTTARTVDLMSQLCDGLEAAHAAKIVHRDIKPDNVFVTLRDGAEFVKILDFGVAKLRREEADVLTATGQAVGTPCYMSPEQARGQKDLDLRADLYAIGVILFECLTGSRPFNAESLPMLIVQILQDPPPPILAYRPDLPEALVAVVDRLLSKEPDERFASASALRAALAPFAALTSPPELAPDPPRHPSFAPPPRAKVGTVRLDGEASAPPPTREAVPTPPPSVPRRSPLVWVGAATVGAVALAGVVFALDLGGAPEPREGDATIAAAIPSPAVEPPDRLQVRLQIDTEPADAELLLDGEVIPNPFDAELDRRDAPFHVQARRDGYGTATREVSARYAQHVHIPLLPAEPGEAPRRVATPSRRGETHPAAPPPTEEPTSPPPVANAATAHPAAAPAAPTEPAPSPPAPDDLTHVHF